MAFDSVGRIVVTGYVDGTIDFGGVNHVASSGQADGFFAKLTPNGDLLYSTIFGGGASDVGYGITVNSSNDSIVVGYHGSQVDFGGGVLNSNGNADAFVAMFAE